MNWEQVWGVLKWVLVVVAAGFVGQFGKSLALFLIQRRKTKQQDPQRRIETASKEGADSASQTERVALQAQAKIEKKRAKARVKRQKKA